MGVSRSLACFMQKKWVVNGAKEKNSRKRTSQCCTWNQKEIMELKFKQKKNLQLMFNRPRFFVIFTRAVILKKLRSVCTNGTNGWFCQIWWQRCWWQHYVDDLILVTILRWYWQKICSPECWRHLVTHIKICQNVGGRMLVPECWCQMLVANNPYWRPALVTNVFGL